MNLNRYRKKSRMMNHILVKRYDIVFSRHILQQTIMRSKLTFFSQHLQQIKVTMMAMKVLKNQTIQQFTKLTKPKKITLINLILMQDLLMTILTMLTARNLRPLRNIRPVKKQRLKSQLVNWVVTKKHHQYH